MLDECGDVVGHRLEAQRPVDVGGAPVALQVDGDDLPPAGKLGQDRVEHGHADHAAVPKVTMIGAGSAVFARTVMTDILAVDGLDTGTFALVDIDPERLELARQIAERLVDLSGKRWTVEASTDRAEVLAGSNYIVNSIEVAGLQNVRADYDIPLRYGVDQ